MCGIYGYVGEAAPVVSLVASALQTMEYRGYDSWGIGWDDGTALLSRKDIGRVPGIPSTDGLSHLAIGHTRWATHGEVTLANAHPHIDATRQIGVVHNGVIENFDALRAALPPTIVMESETDSEIVVHLVAMEIANGANLPTAVEVVFRSLEGNNAIVVAHRPSGEIAAITSRSPLRIGRKESAYHLASDPIALAATADQLAIVPDNAVVLLSSSGVSIQQIATRSIIDPVWMDVPRDAHVSRGAFDHFTLKEIHDQPAVIRQLATRAKDAGPFAREVENHKHIILTGCGSAFYAAALGAEWLRTVLSATWIDVLPASEIDESTRNLGSDTLLIALTQSGETADVVDAVHSARSWGAMVGSLVNTESSSVAHMVDVVLPIRAGMERSVLATKSFMSMVVRLGQITELVGSGVSKMGDRLGAASDAIDGWLTCDKLHELAERIAVHDHVLTLGQGVGHKVALEAALKIKEGSYVHAEAFLTGELKHGPLALVTTGTPALLFAMTDQERDGAKIASREIMGRGGHTVGIGAFASDECTEILHVPDLGMATPLVEVAIAQAFAYHLAIERGVDPDYPRNLAKSVTVR